MASEKTIDKAYLKDKLSKRINSFNKLEHNKQKREDLIEEYKILQNKIESYSSVLLRSRGIMFSLLSGLFVAMLTLELLQITEITLKIIFFFLFSYHLYYEFITNYAREIFQKRISEVENALQFDRKLKTIKTYQVSVYSSSIRVGFFSFIYNFRKDKNARLRVFLPIFIVVLLFGLVPISKFKKNKEYSLTINNKVSDKININKISINKKEFEIIEKNLKQINNSILGNTELIQQLGDNCYELDGK